jgi:hypothetical protein
MSFPRGDNLLFVLVVFEEDLAVAAISWIKAISSMYPKSARFVLTTLPLICTKGQVIHTPDPATLLTDLQSLIKWYSSWDSWIVSLGTIIYPSKPGHHRQVHSINKLPLSAHQIVTCVAKCQDQHTKNWILFDTPVSIPEVTRSSPNIVTYHQRPFPYIMSMWYIQNRLDPLSLVV